MSRDEGRPTVGLDPAEELPSSIGQDEPGNPVRRELWQGPRNDTALVKDDLLTVTFPRIW